MKSTMKWACLASLFIFTPVFAADNHDHGADPTVATVNGVDIKRSTLQLYTVEARQQSQGQPQASRDTLVDDLINMHLLYEEAKAKKLDQSDDYVNRMNYVGMNLLSQIAMQDYVENNPVPDADMKKFYDEQIKQVTFEEFKASHILTETEADANKVIELLNQGGDFAALAKEHSTGPTGPKGGDLGWFNPRQMVPEFSTAVMGLANGEYTKQAVQTQFGWHVILRVGKRDAAPPPFESVKPQINAMMQQQHIQKHIAELRKKAKITKPSESE